MSTQIEVFFTLQYIAQAQKARQLVFLRSLEQN